MFYVFHNRTNSIAEFYWFASYFICEMKVWNEMKSGMGFFGDIEMLHIYEELENLIVFKNKLPNGHWLAASPADVATDQSLMNCMNTYKRRAPFTIEQINRFIQNNQDMFFKIE
ncbi:hypothetical protein JCM16418_606 [Paenibacillus pini JCM 16418]|uniref:Uncharacterized protein n=2 Tax=Paenibacillus TaxID=44249 RepID=W7YQ04_9BACL|nr:hypothetical protein JCM16418_606 [Paenibacillus pini JCM 16418]